MNQVVIDLIGLENKEKVLIKLGEIFKFNEEDIHGRSWGMNFDALDDCLGELPNGGIFGTGNKFEFPLTVVFENYQKFKEKDPDSFKIIKEIFEENSREYWKDGREFSIQFI